VLDAQMGIARTPQALLAVLVQAGLGHLVDAQLLARYVLRTRGADAPRDAEDRPVVGDPAPSVRAVGHIGHPVLHLARRLRDEQIWWEPDQIEVTVGRDSVVGHRSASGLACTARAPSVLPLTVLPCTDQGQSLLLPDLVEDLEDPGVQAGVLD